MFEWLFGKKPRVVQFGADSMVVRNSSLRKGMWVTTLDGKTGILTRAFNDSTAEVHLTDENGKTSAVLPFVPLSNLRQAYWEEIPAARRPPESSRWRGVYLTETETKRRDAGKVRAIR